SVAWQPSGTSNLHSTTADKFSMWTYDLPAGSSTPTPDVVFDRAGGFAYHCRIHGSMRGTVMIQLSPNDTTPVVGQTITITFALNAASPGFAEQIQKRKADGTWRNLSAADTGTSVAWMAPSAKTFQFRARLVQGGVMSSWSPTLQLTVTAN
ncbi:MAG: hypothetical protein QFC55_02710, partial [Chloroflexota bacterium]|nr:hypothetical protein [Chloroflexota bacterium]